MTYQPTKTCPICGQTFKPQRGTRIYCSDRCRQRKHRAQKDNYLADCKRRILTAIEDLASHLKHPDSPTAMECRYYLIDIRHSIHEVLNRENHVTGISAQSKGDWKKEWKS